MAITIVIPSVKDVATSVKKRARLTATTAELLVLGGVKRVTHAAIDKAEAINDRVDNHANNILAK